VGLTRLQDLFTYYLESATANHQKVNPTV